MIDDLLLQLYNTDVYYRAIRTPSLHLVAMDNDCRSDCLSGISQCFMHSEHLLPSPRTDIDSDEPKIKQARLSDVDLSGAGNLLSQQDYHGMFCPHKMKSVNLLTSRQEAYLVTVVDILRCRDVAFSGATCSVVVTWRRQNNQDSGTDAVCQTFGHITLSATDFINPQLGLLFNTSGAYTFLLVIGSNLIYMILIGSNSILSLELHGNVSTYRKHKIVGTLCQRSVAEAKCFE